MKSEGTHGHTANMSFKQKVQVEATCSSTVTAQEEIRSRLQHQASLEYTENQKCDCLNSHKQVQKRQPLALSGAHRSEVKDVVDDDTHLCEGAADVQDSVLEIIGGFIFAA